MYSIHHESGANLAKTPWIGESPSNQPISGPVIFSKRQALSRAVVVNSNMSRGKYLAWEGPGSRLYSSLLSMLGSHKDQWETCVAERRFVLCLAFVEGGKTTDTRGSFSSPSRPRNAPKSVQRKYVCSVSLRFHGYWAWKNVIARVLWFF